MARRRSLTAAALAVGVVAALTAVLTTGSAAVAAPSSGPDLAQLRAATTKFHNIATAEQNGYGLLTDKDGIACIDMAGMGGMGVHWANGTLVGDPAIKPLHPEALVYAPGPDGTLHPGGRGVRRPEGRVGRDPQVPTEAVRARLQLHRRTQQVQPAAVLLAARVGLQAQLGRDVRDVEPGGEVPDLT